MTNHIHPPSLAQARGSNSDSASDSASHTDSRLQVPSTDGISTKSHNHARSGSHAHQVAHRHAHRQPAHDRPDTDIDESSPAPASSPASDSIISASHIDERASGDSSSPDAPSLAAVVDAAVAARADDAASYVTQVVQTVSVIQVVDYSGSPISTQTSYASPNTVVIDPNTGETVSESLPAFTVALNPSNLLSSLLPGLGSDPSSTPSTTSTTHHTVSTTGSVSAPPATTGFPTLSDPSNGTAWGNVTALGSSYNSTVRLSAFTQPTNSSASLSNFLLYSTSSTSTESTSTESTTYLSTPTWNSPTLVPTVAGSTETAPSSPGSASDPLTPQQKQIVGGVVGSVAGVAFLALLLMLALRYKKRRDGQALPGNNETRGFAALGASGSDTTNPMAERNGAAASVTAAFAALTSKRQSTNAEGSDSLAPPGERGFYRVSGRKLPSVLYSGGDGYTDPRESTMSRFSQSSEPFNRGDQPFALGSPMRPVSGVPIMRSGPARTPVTESNPFADPTPSPYDSSPRRPGSSGSPRGSGSRFQESI